jgi:hypothetical protein
LAVAGKESVGVMRAGKLIQREKVPTSFVMDMDVNCDGIVGVTQ